MGPIDWPVSQGCRAHAAGGVGAAFAGAVASWRVVYGGGGARSRETFADAAERWLARRRPALEASTYRDYETHLRLRLVPAFGHLRLRQLERGHVEDYLARLDETSGLSRKSINDSLIPLRQIMQRAVADGLISHNPAASRERDAPSRASTRASDNALPHPRRSSPLPGRNRGLVAPTRRDAPRAGLRIGEAIALEWRDIDWDASALNISRTVKYGGIGTPNGDRARAVLIDSFLLKLLHEHRAAQPGADDSPKVFNSPHGAGLDRHNVRRRGHHAAVLAAGLDRSIQLHDLRHTAATLWLAAGASIYFVQRQLGHKDIQTTIDLYGHPDQSRPPRRR
jgi:integrase